MLQIDRYRRCSRCIMDTTAGGITFNADGVCNYCSEFEANAAGIVFEDESSRSSRLALLLENVKRAGRGKRYDCIIGVSGGVDSSWALVNAVELGLRPLAVHMDNGWNSELAQNNIANLVRGLGVDLYTHVINWPEYRALMQAFFDADVIDIELLYDNAMLAVNYHQARKYGLKHILSGSNSATEGMSIPRNWNWFKRDKANIKGIAKTFANVRLQTFPSIGSLEYVYYEYVRKTKWISFLDFLDFDKEKSLESLEKNYRYKRYPYKHYESIFTRFYQGYILPEKFGVDKRKLHLSTLIMSGQLSRTRALELIEQSPYPFKEDLDADRQYFLKKMGWTPAVLTTYLNRPEVSHDHYTSEKWVWDLMVSAKQALRGFLGPTS
ncbi:N-acetyl sugar amidotransferase [Shinella sp. H4-D48]|uniref:N-acetyl sugar amidotransferase n=1 Tax=Shinella sp. H4-D48 TaxID=2925841 RepID=UPI001F53D977|nr:N-acetyl sugar amidotransferase [Shinella sp. H4-D48]UNK38237.1 N-acetyl sugar amidotransferase [Shinella sp. H4-D48]